MKGSTLDRQIQRVATQARSASEQLATVSEGAINRALRRMTALLKEQRGTLERHNAKDLEQGRSRGLSEAMLDRLTLSDKTFRSMATGLSTLTKLKSSVGTEYDERRMPNGLSICRRRVPIGVVAIIYESRPNVTVDAAAICLKSRNAVILRGGSEAFNSNKALASLFSRALKETGLPQNAVQLVPTTDRAAIEMLLTKPEQIDLVIPRGGEGLIRTVVEKSQIPVIKHYKGVCHVFVSRNADMRIALPIVVNAKVQRPGVCNAMETLLIDKGLSKAAQRKLVDALLAEGVELRGDKDTCALYPKTIKRATRQDWEAEYLDLRLAVRIVDGIDQAIEHVNTYGSHHTDAIVSRSKAEIAAFLDRVDSSSVMVNASTRFSDGGEYGMGCEIGISTDKLQSRGPMGIDDLTTYKWIVRGKGQTRG
ncbi:MAG: glutamate-5-semialdehyde dehydrogenase [Chitinivibrionales bacterium]|nr:glutamate-5-semialdehyde dehydrogenase [Chitinivibrionales bacterium]